MGSQGLVLGEKGHPPALPAPMIPLLIFPFRYCQFSLEVFKYRYQYIAKVLKDN